MGSELGELDYVICHGVYSWCPPIVQERILTLCQQQLAPHGIAYISFNVQPGWHRMGLWRDLMRWAAGGDGDWRARVREGRRFLDIVAQASASSDPLYAQLVKDGADKLRKLPESYLLHEFLEIINEPIHFHEMVARVEAKGLQYLGESCRQTDLADLPPPVRERLEKSGFKRVEVEQYVDFLTNASFRRSLFCRAGLTLEDPQPPRIAGLHLNTLCEPASPEPEVTSDKEESFRAEKGQLTTDIPLVKAILVALWRAWPRTRTLPELTEDVRRLLDAVDDPELTDEVVAETALHCHGSNLVALHRWTPPFATQVSERPVANGLARLQAGLILATPQHMQGRGVSNLRHRNVPLNPFELAVLRQLDGTRDRAALIDALVRDSEAAVFVIEKGGARVRGVDVMRTVISDSLGPTLGRLAHGALLVS
jgi:methyltransferase-like protein